MRMTVSGEGGTGKSFVIKCIVSHLRRLVPDNDIVHILAPTGTASFNVGGETIHDFVGLSPTNMDALLGEKTKKELSDLLQFSMALIIDERSMVDLKLLGALEKSIAMTAHECCHSKDMWGGIPIVMLLGDDYQLPSIRDGVTTITDKKIPKYKNLQNHCNGMVQFLDLTNEVVFLDQIMRQDSNQIKYK